MNGEKKKWEKPELVVLLRSRPEEAVLTACKNIPSQIGGSTFNGGCQTWTGICQTCYALASS
jgi:hypothetical protein